MQRLLIIRRFSTVASSSRLEIIPPDTTIRSPETLDIHEDGAPDTAPMRQERRPLPLSPIMHSQMVSARRKYRSPKAKPSKTLTLLQTKLKNNPYAQALATPIRTCRLTNVRLPSFFLIKFSLMEHPETGKLWCLPDKISCKCSLASNEVGQPGAAEAIDDTGQFNMLKDLNSPSGAISTIKVQAQEKEGPGTYILAREAMLAALSQPDRLWKKVSRRTWSFNRKTVDDSVWRDDMRGLVKELLRERVVHELIYLSTRRRGYVSGSTDTMEEILVRKQVGAILWMGSGSASHESAGAEKLEKRPVEFSSFVYGCSERRPVPVYNLQRLIGEEWVERLIALPGKEYSRSVAVLRSRRGTVAAQMALWRLEGYLAKYA